MQQIGKYLFYSLIIAALYFATGWLGLLLTVPPGHATTIWPPSGLALVVCLFLGSRYIPAIFIGAMAVSFSHGDILSGGIFSVRAHEFLLPAMVATGACLQACLSAGLVRRWGGFPSALERVRDLAAITFGGGVIGCLVNATIGTAAVYNAGVIGFGDVLKHWYIWWSGDVLGVIVFAPALILLFGHKVGVQVSAWRKALVLLPTFFMFCVVAVLFFQIKTDKLETAHKAFSEQTKDLDARFQKETASYRGVMIAVERFISSSQNVTAKEFATFTKPFFTMSPGLAGLSWVPMVKDEDRAAFENDIRAQGYSDFEIKDRTAPGVMVRAPHRAAYWPLTYLEPMNMNKMAHGFDAGGHDPMGSGVRQWAMDKARDTGVFVATDPVPVASYDYRYGVIVYEPVYRDGVLLKTVEERRAAIRGYVSALFFIGKVMKPISEVANKYGIDFVLEEISDKDETYHAPHIVYDSRTTDYKRAPDMSYDFKGDNVIKQSVEVASRHWRLVFMQRAPLSRNFNGAEMWLFIAAGTLFSGLLGFFMMVVTAQTDIVGREVERKTRDLKELNAELEEFTYRTSHDLRAPVASSMGLLDAASEMVSSGNTELALETIEHARRSMGQLDIIVQDILNISQAKNMDEVIHTISLEKIINRALEKLSYMDGFENISVHKNILYSGDVRNYEVRVKGVIENLLSNAVKYQDFSKPTHKINIEVSASQDRNYIFVRIEDNGLGVPKSQRGNLFKMFRRFHPNHSFGSGLGLYLVKKSAAIAGGDVVYEDTGDGSAFTFSMCRDVETCKSCGPRKHRAGA